MKTGSLIPWLSLTLCAGLIALAPLPAAAEDKYWLPATGDWSDPANWDPGGVPTSADNAYIDNDGTASILLGTATAGTAYVGYEQAGTVSHAGGTFATDGQIYLGYALGAAGYYELGAAGTLEARYVRVGRGGSGTFAQVGGNCIGDVLVAAAPSEYSDQPVSGLYELQAGLLSSEYTSIAGGSPLAEGVLVQTGGSHVVDQWVNVASFSGNGTYQMLGGTLQTGSLGCAAGHGPGGFELGLPNAQFVHSGGLVQVENFLHLGFNGHATYSLTGSGELVSQVVSVGKGQVGDPEYEYSTEFIQTGGTHTVGPGAAGALGIVGGIYRLSNGFLSSTDIYVGAFWGGWPVWWGEKGTFLHSGGVCEVERLCMDNSHFEGAKPSLYELSGSATLSALRVEVAGGRFQQTGGTHSVADELVLGLDSSSAGSYELQGGILSMPIIRTGGGSCAFNFTGGTLHAGTIEFDLLNDGGVLAPGQSIGTTAITGSYTQNAGTLEIELGQDATDSLAVTGLATLGGTLELVSLGLRPREGQTFAVVTADGGFVDDFSEVLSDIVNGIPEGLEAFSTAINGTAYEVVFNGYTAGDANGDHKASLGDLSIMAGNWKQSGKGWADGDFNGDGIVRIGDLSMLAGNWGSETLPPASAPLPEPATVCLLAFGGLAAVRKRPVR